MKNEHQGAGARGGGEDGWEYFYQGTANPQPGCAAPRWSRADWVSITNVAPFISALNQSELEFSGLMYIFFSLQNLALFSTNSMPCLRNCKSNEGRGFLNHAWDALAKLWGTSRSTCLGCSWQRWELLGFPFPDRQMKTTFKEAVPIACLILVSNGWWLRWEEKSSFPFHRDLFTLSSLHIWSSYPMPLPLIHLFFSSFFSLYNLPLSYVTNFQNHNSLTWCFLLSFPPHLLTCGPGWSRKLFGKWTSHRLLFASAGGGPQFWLRCRLINVTKSSDNK